MIVTWLVLWMGCGDNNKDTGVDAGQAAVGGWFGICEPDGFEITFEINVTDASGPSFSGTADVNVAFTAGYQTQPIDYAGSVAGSVSGADVTMELAVTDTAGTSANFTIVGDFEGEDIVGRCGSSGVGEGDVFLQPTDTLR
ncbi:MAG: hypothetical protein AAFV53_42565 [Myxococcota bacterium]